MSARRTIIAGNWKMNKTRQEAKGLVGEIVKGLSAIKNLPEIVLCPPFTSLTEVTEAKGQAAVEIGAQNMDWRDSGAYTGEISPLMLVDLGLKYVVLGHSERRQYFGETNQTVNEKVKASLKHNLVPIVCVGETLDERENDLTDPVVSRQIAAGLADLSADDVAKIVIAYEPVWAIGTGKVCEATEANRVCALIRKTVANLKGCAAVAPVVPILYGGSVNPKNIEEQMAQEDIDGSLVGGASLKADEFLAIIAAAAKRPRLSAAKS